MKHILQVNLKQLIISVCEKRVIAECRIFILNLMPVKWIPTPNCLSMTSGNTKKAFRVSISDEIHCIKKWTYEPSASFLQQRKEKWTSEGCTPGLIPNVSAATVSN